MTGLEAEYKAIELLKARGHEIIHHDYRLGRIQVDIVSTKSSTLFVAEVKYRRWRTDLPEELMSLAQQERIFAAAGQLLGSTGLNELALILIHYYGDGTNPVVFPLNVS
ncbi:MAG: YraN family protein [Schleiferiaceae bacterium]|jgi:Holliday junction resolvase-like predicted endonuclease|nr:MAG: Uncharacterised protein [Cryomorphaceae bacterium]